MDNVAAVGLALSVLIAAGAFALYIIRGEIARASKDVQPRNGGNGWQDLHDKVTLLVDRQGDIVDDVRYLRVRLDTHIDTSERRFAHIETRTNEIGGAPHA